MSTTLQLAHLSDIHLGPLPGFRPEHWNLKRGLGYVNWHRKRRHVHQPEVAAALLEDAARHNVDHIAITGDLINIGLPAEYEAAARWLATVGPPERVSLIPGNHDIYTRLRSDPGVERWRAYMRPDGYGEGVGPPPASGFPYVRRLGPVALIGLNSALPTPPAIAAGRLGEEQLAALARALDRLRADGLTRVVLIHHPPLPGQADRRRGLADAKALEDVLQRHGAELVLHGHNHLDMYACRRWQAGDVPVIGVASGSAGRRHGREPLGRYNLFRFEPLGGGTRIELIGRGLQQPGGPVVELERRTVQAGPGDEQTAGVARGNLTPHARHSVP